MIRNPRVHLYAPYAPIALGPDISPLTSSVDFYNPPSRRGDPQQLELLREKKIVIGRPLSILTLCPRLDAQQVLLRQPAGVVTMGQLDRLVVQEAGSAQAWTEVIYRQLIKLRGK